MRTIAITEPYFYPGEGARIADALMRRGFWRVHIRKPGAAEERVRALLCEIPRELYPRLSMHDHFSLAQELHLGGVHLNRRHPEPPQGWNGLVSRSLHTVEELACAGTREDYLFISPVYPSISKTGYCPSFSIAELKPYLGERVFALGGVTPGCADELSAAGFGGAAMLGAAWRVEPDMEAFGMQFITHPTSRLTVTEGAAEALRGGCRWIQLRHKDASPQLLAEEGRRIARLCREHGAVFIVDDHVDMVESVGADGVHLGKNDMPVDEARRMLGPHKIIGATANTFADIESAAAAGADYIGLGPFRFTQTKRNLSPVLGTEGYRRIAAECRARGIRLPIVAIGGITDADIPGILHTGVSGIALSSSVLSASSPATQAAQTMKIIKNSITNG